MKSKKLNKETIQSIATRDLSYPDFQIGDVVEIAQWVQEGDENKRIQTFQGNVIAKSNNAASSTFTVRKMAADGVAVERIFPLYSPIIDSIRLVSKARVRRAKLYYIRHKVGEDAIIKEKVVRKTAKASTSKAA
ncbi:50S ribosomal protein L19 [Candidatus Dependentiae bacterium]|nr:50S ribosomal protein L19 [Candidatus Dependentiae bacterium]